MKPSGMQTSAGIAEEVMIRSGRSGQGRVAAAAMAVPAIDSNTTPAEPKLAWQDMRNDYNRRYPEGGFTGSGSGYDFRDVNSARSRWPAFLWRRCRAFAAPADSSVNGVRVGVATYQLPRPAAHPRQGQRRRHHPGTRNSLGVREVELSSANTEPAGPNSGPAVPPPPSAYPPPDHRAQTGGSRGRETGGPQ